MTSSLSCAALTLLAATALAPDPARAQPAPGRRPSAAAAPAARAAPAGRVSPLATPTPAAPTPTAAALPAPLAATPAAAADPRSRFGERWRGDVLVGLERAEGDGALKVRADVERDLVPLSPGATVSGFVSAGLVHSSETESTTVGGVTSKAEATADRLELVPSLRVRISPAPRVTLHADAGLGATYTTARAEVTVAGVSASDSSSAAGGVLRFGLGGSYAASDRVRISAEVLGLNFHYGEAKGRSVTFLAGAGYRF